MNFFAWFLNLFRPHHLPAPIPVPTPVPLPPPVPPPSPAPAPVLDPASAGPAALALINRFRASRNLGPLQPDPALAAAALAYARRLAAARAEDHSLGGSPASRIAAALAPRPVLATGECLAVGQPGPEAVVDRWSSPLDPGHRAILLGDYRIAGVGVATGDTPLTVAGQPAPANVPGTYWVFQAAS